MVSPLTLNCSPSSSHVWPLFASIAACSSSFGTCVGLPARGMSSSVSSPSLNLLNHRCTVRVVTTPSPKAWHIFRLAAVAFDPSLKLGGSRSNNPFN